MKYVKTTVVEAVLWTGDNPDAIRDFVEGAQLVFGKDGFVSVYNANGSWEVDLTAGSYMVKGDKDWITCVDKDELHRDYKRVRGVVFPNDADS